MVQQSCTQYRISFAGISGVEQQFHLTFVKLTFLNQHLHTQRYIFRTQKYDMIKAVHNILAQICKISGLGVSIVAIIRDKETQMYLAIGHGALYGIPDHEIRAQYLAKISSSCCETNS